MNRTFSVSVIIPNYNRESIIGETIENMLKQSVPPFEIIIIDDGSTDNSLEVIKRYGKKVKLIQQSNKGPGAARNLGLKVASCEFIQFMDSDDLVSLNKIEVQVKTLANSEADIVYGPWAKIWKTGNRIRLQNVVLQQEPLPKTKSPLFWFLTDWSMVFQHCLIRREVLNKVGGFREDIYAHEDSDLFIKLLLAGARLIHESESLTFYRLNDYGKLTNTGLNANKRSLGNAVFYSSVINLIDNFSEVKSSSDHIKFRVKVWKALKDLKKNHLSVAQNGGKLEKHIGGKNCELWLMSLLMQYKGGMMERIHGHRWSKAFKAGCLTKKQKMLIHDLGWIQTNNTDAV